MAEIELAAFSPHARNPSPTADTVRLPRPALGAKDDLLDAFHQPGDAAALDTKHEPTSSTSRAGIACPTARYTSIIGTTAAPSIATLPHTPAASSDQTQQDPLPSPPASEVGLGGSLPPVDGGVAAWTFVFVAWIAEVSLWAPNFSIGTFQSY